MVKIKGIKNRLKIKRLKHCVAGLNIFMVTLPFLIVFRMSAVCLSVCSYFFDGSSINAVAQRPQTRGMRAACGPPDEFVRPEHISKTEKIINFCQI
jgi:hypothetical protein